MKNEDPLRRRYLRWMWVGLALLAALAYPAAFHSQAAINSLLNDPPDWVPNTLREKQEFNYFRKYFSVSDVIMIAWEESDLDSDLVDRVAAVLRPLCQDQGDQAQAGEAELLEAWSVLTPENRSAAERLLRDCGDAPPLLWVRTGGDMLEHLTSTPVNLSRSSAVQRLRGTIVGPNDEQTCLLISVAASGHTHRRDLIPTIRAMIADLVGFAPDQVAVVGGIFEGATVDTESIRSIRVFTPISSLIATMLCWLCLRSIPLTTVIIAVASIGQGLVLAAVYYIGIPMNAVLLVLPPLVFVLTVSAGIHLSNYYFDAFEDSPELSPAEAAQRAMKAGVKPCLLAAGTTVVGLSSLLLVRLQPVQVFGGVASAGVVITLTLLMMLIPGAMMLTRPRRTIQRGGPLGTSTARGLVKRWMRRRLTRPWPLIGAFGVAAVVLSLGLPRLESSVNIPRLFLPDSDIRRQYSWFEDNVGSTVNGEILVTFSNIPKDQDPLKRLEIVGRVQRNLLELAKRDQDDQASVGGVMSALTFIPPIAQRRSLAATAQRSVVRRLIRDPDSSLGKLGFIARDGNTEVWRLSLQIPQHAEVDHAKEIEIIQKAANQAIVGQEIPVAVSLTGKIVIIQRAQEVLLNDLFRSFVTAFAVIALVMVLMLRNLLGGLLAMAPNVFPTIALFGTMGIAKIPLDIGSVMTASVALGIAIDDTVHLLSRFGYRRSIGIGQIRSAYGALIQCGWAMFQTTLVCGLSLMVYWFSDFVPTSQFAVLMFALLATALLGVILLLPTMMASPLGRFLSPPIQAREQAGELAFEKPADARRLVSGWQNSESLGGRPPVPAITRRSIKESEAIPKDPAAGEPNS